MTQSIHWQHPPYNTASPLWMARILVYYILDRFGNENIIFDRNLQELNVKFRSCDIQVEPGRSGLD